MGASACKPVSGRGRLVSCPRAQRGAALPGAAEPAYMQKPPSKYPSTTGDISPIAKPKNKLQTPEKQNPQLVKVVGN